NTSRATLTSTSGYTYLMPGQSVSAIDKLTPVTPGETISASMLVACSVAGNRNLRFGFRNSWGAFQSWSADGPSTALQADGDLVELKIENVTVPSGAAYAYVHTRGPLEGQGNWVEGTHAQIVKSSSIPDYFDGDTPSGATDNESHYRWTGTPHASTSEKYLPAIPDSGSDAWNITEQWQYTSAGWKPVEVSHEVIATVDLGKATVGELDGIRIMARTMSSDVFTGTAFEGYIFKGTTFQTTNGSEFSDRGLFMYVNDGNPRIQAPVDGSDFTINAEVVSRSLTAVGRASFLAEDNRVEPGAGLVLAAGVGDPPSPPVVSTYYPQIKPPALEGEETASGLAYGDGLFWRAVDAGDGFDHLDRIEGFDHDGAIQQTISLEKFWARNGLTVIGNELFALGRRDDLPASTRNNSRWVRVFGLDGTYKRQWEYKEYGSGTYQPGIGQDE